MAITFNRDTRTFYLDGKGTTYAFCINPYGYAEHLYYGKTIAHDDLRGFFEKGSISYLTTIPGYGPDKCPENGPSYHHFPSELSFFGTGDFREPAVLVTFPDGTTLSELLYAGHEILPEKPRISGMPSMQGGETLLLHLKDRITSFGCDLYYTVYDDCGVIARRAVYRNDSGKPLCLNRAYTFTFSLPSQDYEAVSFFGSWAHERHIERTPLHHGVFQVDSKRCTSSAVLNPFIAVASPEATEEYGDVYGFDLVYSSSFALKAEGTSDGRLLVTGGINDFRFEWKLSPGETFETPEVILNFSGNGFGGMSRDLHDALRRHLINPRYVQESRPIVINNWEATYFHFDSEKLKAIIRAVEGTGIDTFVLDDGWFGERNSDEAGLGDWVVNTEKLPGGLAEISDYAHSLGMRFGLWFEPEMVNEDSDLFRTHPDYAIGVPNRPRCYGRHQFMLDLTRRDVRDFIVESVNRILHENRIEYVKWDYNRNVSENFSLGLEPDREKEFDHRYALGVYDLFERIVSANPDVFFEGCSSGGGRFDSAVLAYFPQIWTSDCSDAEERTLIQYGTSYMYPLSSMSCHFSASPNHQTGRLMSEESRADIAHLGATGYELDTSCFTDQDRAMVKEQVTQYKRNEHLILNGDLYRTENPFESNFFGFNVVSKDKKEALLTVFRRLRGANDELKYWKVRGLDENKRYRIDGMEGSFSGATLMSVGLPCRMPWGDFCAHTYRFTEEEA